ncbi:hypothetical protein WJX72_002444 [[Myrmecia] bisecta]|uniref:Exocyst subunit Exo70 family protein n=1 Tax=[Myrmecia] bisecta TaxID=41462 RepID=A0AAW1PS98_9CHLO
MAASDSLAGRIEALQSSLVWSQSLSREACNVLDTYAQQLVELQGAVAPVAARSAALIQARENIKTARDKAEEVLDHLDTSRKVEARILQGPRADLDGFLKALERLDRAITFLKGHRSLSTTETALSHATDLRRDAMQLGLEDFLETLRANSPVPNASLMTSSAFSEVSHHSAPAEQSGPAEVELVPAPVLPRVRKLSEAMLACGEAACVKVYCEVRRSVVERTLQGLGNQQAASDDFAKMSWPQLEKKIQGWILALRVLVHMVVAEAKLSKAVFTAPYAEAAFTEVIARSTAAVVAFGTAIVRSRRTPEKVFGLLDMHEHLDHLLPALEHVLEGTTGMQLAQDLLQLNSSLRREARDTFVEFEASIARDPPKHTVPDGTVHPLSAYTLSFLKRLFTYDSAMPILFGDASSATPQSSRSDGSGSLASEAQPLRTMIASITHLLDVLTGNLQAKAASYKNKALAALFLMNNVHYLVKTVEASEALVHLGEDWIERHKDQVEQYGEEYQTLSWRTLIQLVKEDSNLSGQQLTWNKEKASIKEKFKALNTAISALHESQSQWTIPDPLLRANMKDAIAQDFLPFYQEFLDRYKVVPFSKTPEKYIKYRVDDLQRMLQDDFFEMKEDIDLARASGTSFLARSSAR